MRISMHEVHLVPVFGTDPIAAVERACSAIGLAVTLRGTLAAYPGSTHWHVKKDNAPCLPGKTPI
jgi:hypothetical protein